MMNRSMKDSGVEWIGDIPEYWNIVRVKRLFTYKKEKVGVKSEDYERLSLTLKGVLKRPKNDSEGLQPEKFSGYQIIEYNDLVFKLIDLENISTSRVGLSNFTGIVSPAYLRLICSDDVDSKFGYYFFISMWYQNIFNGLGGDGVRSNLNSSDLLNLSFVDVPKSEQQKIAAFLDEKVAYIDNIIEDTKKSIENLKAYKQSLITETVTKGLDSNVEMKDSGIEWVKKVPKHWRINKVRYFMKEKSVKNHPNEMVLSLYRDYGVVPKNSRDDNHNVTSLNTETYKLVEENELVINKMKAWQGSLAISKYKGIISPAYYIFAIDQKKLLPEFLHYMFRNPVYIDEYKRLSAGIRPGQWDLNKDEFKNVLYAYPESVQEQKKIAEFLDGKTYQIDSLINQKEQLITELEAYKKSLIYEYVTGKKEVK